MKLIDSKAKKVSDTKAHKPLKAGDSQIADKHWDKMVDKADKSGKKDEKALLKALKVTKEKVKDEPAGK